MDTTAAQLRVVLCLWVPVRERAFWTWRRAKDADGRRKDREGGGKAEKRRGEEEEEGTISNLSCTKDRRKREKRREG